MKISTRGRYALEAMLDLAINAASEYESLRNISERRNISENYLEHIFMQMKNKGIVESLRGAGGGYRLAKDAGRITSGEILRAVEGQLAPVACVDCEVEGSSCRRYDTCVTRTLWTRIMEEINDAADSVTLSDLVKCHNSIDQSGRIEYFI